MSPEVVRTSWDLGHLGTNPTSGAETVLRVPPRDPSTRAMPRGPLFAQIGEPRPPFRKDARALCVHFQAAFRSAPCSVPCSGDPQQKAKGESVEASKRVTADAPKCKECRQAPRLPSSDHVSIVTLVLRPEAGGGAGGGSFGDGPAAAIGPKSARGHGPHPSQSL